MARLKDLIKDWGTHLDSRLYKDALVHPFGGEAQCLQRLELTLGPLKLGTHPVQPHSSGHAFVVTSFFSYQEAYQRQLDVLLDHAALDGVQWINLHRARVEITAIARKDRRMETEE